MSLAFDWDNNFSESRKIFKKNFNFYRKFYPKAELGSIPIGRNEDLTFDYVYFPAKKENKKIWIMTAGVHGIESFVGSAIVNWLFKEKIEDLVDEQTGVLLFHSINPFGYENKRRVNENNVDLNRNFILDFSKFDDPNQEYKKFDKFLNEKKAVSISNLSKFKFLISGFYHILKYGMSSLRQSIVSGQYSFAKGVFFGGKKKQQSYQFFEQITDKYINDYQTIFHIDFHTGYGERGTLHFYGISNYDEKSENYINELFNGFNIDAGSDEDFYLVHGDITSFLAKKYKDKIVIPMTFEYGTLDSQTIKGSLDSLSRMRNENQLYHFGAVSSKASQQVTNDFMEMFNPSDPLWRDEIKNTTIKTFKVLIERFKKL